jgi:hypothetical protein
MSVHMNQAVQATQMACGVTSTKPAGTDTVTTASRAGLRLSTAHSTRAGKTLADAVRERLGAMDAASATGAAKPATVYDAHVTAAAGDAKPPALANVHVATATGAAARPCTQPLPQAASAAHATALPAGGSAQRARSTPLLPEVEAASHVVIR